MAKVRGECLYCSNRLPLYLKLKNADFCSEAHKSAYYEEQQRLALQRLIETEKILSGARARALPLREQRGVLTGDEAGRLNAGTRGVPSQMAGPILRPLSQYTAADWRCAAVYPLPPAILLTFPRGPSLDLEEHFAAGAAEAEPVEPSASLEASSDALAALAFTTLNAASAVRPRETFPVECADAFPYGIPSSYPRLDVTGHTVPAGSGHLEVAAAVAYRPAATAVAADAPESPAPAPPGRSEGDAIALPVWMTPARPPNRGAAVSGPEWPRQAPILPAVPERRGVAHSGPGGHGGPEPERMAPRPGMPATGLAATNSPALSAPVAVKVGAAAPAGMRPSAAHSEPPLLPVTMPTLAVAYAAGREPLPCETDLPLPQQPPRSEPGPRACGPVRTAPNLSAVLPGLKVSLITGEPLLSPRTAVMPGPREAPATIPAVAPPLNLRRGSAVPAPVRSLPPPAVQPFAGPPAARSLAALRRAREPVHATPPMCVRIVPMRVAAKPADDVATAPVPPVAGGALPSMAATCLPTSGLRPQRWVEPPAEPLPSVQPRFQRPPEAAVPIVRPALPQPMAPPGAAIPVPRFRPSPRVRLKRIAERVMTPAGWILMAALAGIAGVPPALTQFGGSAGVRQSVGNLVAGVQETIGSRSGVRFVEDFRSRFDQWEGQRDPLETWKVDASGFVMPGELAVFKPSARMADYRVEFLGGIERKAVSWAFRVQDLENYYVAKVAVSRPGPLPALALERYAVVGGKETLHRTNPISLTIRGGSMMKVSMNAKGSDFDIRIDGRIVDSWTDARIGRGGVGFFSGKGESSKIRWVKVEYQYDILGRVCSWFAASPVMLENSR